jgi:hypothetical protein
MMAFAILQIEPGLAPGFLVLEAYSGIAKNYPRPHGRSL